MEHCFASASKPRAVAPRRLPYHLGARRWISPASERSRRDSPYCRCLPPLSSPLVLPRAPQRHVGPNSHAPSLVILEPSPTGAPETERRGDRRTFVGAFIAGGKEGESYLRA